MADESTQSIVINAEPARIMAVIADLPAYPEWAAAVKTTEVLDRDEHGFAKRVRFAVDQGPLKDNYVLDYTWATDGLSVRWQLIEGQMQKSQQGSYVLSAENGSTRVTYTLSVQLTIPIIGLFRRKAEKLIMDTALGELKRRVESAN